MRIKSFLGAAACSVALIGLNTAPAFAQGQVERGTDHANSICSFSGLNDVPNDPVEGGRVQSYGQIIKSPDISPADMKAHGEAPGILCNGHNFPYPEAFPPPAP
ncbi:hypothetical protein [Pseudarthrobacter sp. L1SW]|uniref:hypothetical protein n=1 Tax=Pseudarthrobacter sp. L1SW TaxID=2851598 RepID=UPI001E3B30E4|nr:hypothetical protein [Pseudarthrobacter sp. L1SW]UEL29686.1 hypothetical protein KTR40_06095 [Pseudarthrobacter sp. L1SW]